MSEFEDRENELLGELPDSILKERGESASDNIEPDFIPPGTLAEGRTGAGIPLDIQREQRRLQGAEGGTLGSPPRDLSVTSVWDARPMNARDFLVTGTDTILFANGGPAKKRAEFFYTVPSGYTGVWRNFSYTPNDFFVPPPQDTLEFDGIKITLLRDNVVIPDFESMQLGQSAGFTPCFVIGVEGTQFTIRLDVSDAYLSEVGDATYLFSINGTNLLTRGLPPEFEIASQESTGQRG